MGLLVTQFLGAINDNMFRWLVVPISKGIIEQTYGEEHVALALSAGLACFVLPYILLAAPAGYLADRFSKRTVIVGCKVAELLIMVLIFFGIMYFMIIRPQSKRAKEHKKLVEALSKGDEVVTNGGMLGKITEVGDNFIQVEIAEGTEVKVQRQAISAVMPKGTSKSL